MLTVLVVMVSHGVAVHQSGPYHSIAGLVEEPIDEFPPIPPDLHLNDSIFSRCLLHGLHQPRPPPQILGSFTIAVWQPAWRANDVVYGGR